MEKAPSYHHDFGSRVRQKLLVDSSAQTGASGAVLLPGPERMINLVICQNNQHIDPDSMVLSFTSAPRSGRKMSHLSEPGGQP